VESPADSRRGRRWSEDPDLREAVDRVLVQLSQDVNLLREHVDWSQDDLAAAAGVSDGTVLDVEKARTDPRISTLVRLAFVFGYEVDVRFRRRRPAFRRVPAAEVSTMSG